MIEGTQDNINPREGDQVINCSYLNCEIAIIFTPRDQQFFQDKGWGKPRYCKKHREQVRAERGNYANKNIRS